MELPFNVFVENLGMNAPFLRPEDPEIRAAQVRSHGSRERVHAGAASAMSFFGGADSFVRSRSFGNQGRTR